MAGMFSGFVNVSSVSSLIFFYHFVALSNHRKPIRNDHWIGRYKESKIINSRLKYAGDGHCRFQEV